MCSSDLQGSSSHTTGRGSGGGGGGGDDDDGGDGGGGRVITISKVLVLRFEAPLFFANCRALSRRLMVELERRGLRKEGRRWIGCVLDLGSVGWVDVTAADVLKHPVKMFGKHGLPIYLARANRKTATMLRATGLTRELERFGGGATVSVHDAVKDLLTFGRAAEKAKRRAAKAEQRSRRPGEEERGREGKEGLLASSGAQPLELA